MRRAVPLGGVDFVAVVGFDDFDVVAFVQHAGNGVKNMEAEIDADAEVGGEHNAGFLGGGGDGGLAGVVKAGGADDGFDAVCRAVIKQRQGGVGAAEVDEHVAAGQGGGRCRR